MLRINEAAQGRELLSRIIPYVAPAQDFPDLCPYYSDMRRTIF